MSDKRDLSQEEVFSNDEDPVEAIMALRRAEEEAAASGEPGAPAEGSDEVADTPEDDRVDDTEQNTGETSDEAQDDPEFKEENSDGVLEGDVEDSAQPEAEPAKVKTRKFKADGKEYEFTEQEMLDQFESVFGKAINFTQKTQKLAPYRKMISALEEESITSDQLDLAIDALKGDKGALAKLAKMNEIDPFDLSDEELQNNYTPKQYGKDQTQLDIDEIVSKISKDSEFQITKSVIDETWDQQSRIAFAENPSMIEGLHNDIKSGLYDKVAPLAMKLKVLDGNAKKSDLEYYMLAGQQLMNQKGQAPTGNPNAKAQAAESKFDQASSEAQRKRAATSTRTRADRKPVTNYLDDNDEAFDEWYKNLTASN